MKKNRKNIFRLLVLLTGMPFFMNVPASAQNQSELQDVQQIVAIVNDKVISLFDLKQRTLLLAVTGGQQQFTQEQQQFIQRQAMEALIDDILKMEEAEKFEANSTSEELEQAFSDYATQLNMETEELESQLEQAGVDKRTMLMQMAGSMAWTAVVQGLLMPMVNVTDDEVMNFIEKMERDKGKAQYNLKEIFLLVTDNTRRDETIETAKLIAERLREGAQFEAVAQQFSQSSTAAVGGDLGWIMTDELSTEMSGVVPNMEPGQVSDPIVTEDGIYIIKLEDTSRILELNNSDIAVQIRYMLFDKTQPEGVTLDQVNSRIYPEISQTDTCELFDEKVANLGAIDAGDIGTVRLGALPRELHSNILALEVGSGSELFEDEEGFRAMILCNKTIPQVQVPDFETVLQNIQQNRLQLVARRHLRDLRRDAIIDYR